MNNNHNQSPERIVPTPVSERLRVNSLGLAMLEASVRQEEISLANTQVNYAWDGFRASNAPISNVVYADFGNTAPELGTPVEPVKFVEKQPEAGIELTKEELQSHNREFMSDDFYMFEETDKNYINGITAEEAQSANVVPINRGEDPKSLASEQTFDQLLAQSEQQNAA